MKLEIGKKLSILIGPAPEKWKIGVVEFTVKVSKGEKLKLRIDISYIDGDSFIGLLAGQVPHLVVTGTFNPQARGIKGNLTIAPPAS